jgi:glyoxylase-like metal-dependent hydrolase (beta-lactamase superfamily II)
MKKSHLLAILLCSTVMVAKGEQPSAAPEKPFIRDGFEMIQPNIYRLQDACNVYLIKSGSSGILIDAGSENLTEALAGVGVSQIDWVLHTHFHRDQCIGTAELRNSGAKIAIGKLEEGYLQPGDLQSNTPIQSPIPLSERYLLRDDLANYGRRMEPFQKPGVDRGLSEGDIITWNQYKIRTIDTPGHTKGSVSYEVEVDGQTICFSGDLIMQGGYVRDFYSLQWIYLQNPGIDSSMVSIDKISTLNPDLMLPSHGASIDESMQDLRLLKSRLSAVQKNLSTQRAGRWNWSNFVQVSAHVIQDCGSTSQLVISESGEALLYDCGKEFTAERLAEAKQKFGITRVAVIIPSHWHYDHIDGIPALAESEGAEIWVWDKLKEHVESPENFLTTCWGNTKFKADRVLAEGESFDWGGYTFGVFHNPVHMEQQMGLSALIDGMKFYFIADGSSINREGYMRSSIHCYNGISTHTALINTAQSFYDANPYICLGAHSNVFALHNDARGEFREWAMTTTDAIKNTLPPGHSETGFNPYWATFYPAKTTLVPGGETEMHLRIVNRKSHTVSGTIWLHSSEDVVFTDQVISYTISPGETGKIAVALSVEQKCRPGTHIITADIEFDNEFYGELPTGYIQIDE